MKQKYRKPHILFPIITAAIFFAILVLRFTLFSQTGFLTYQKLQYGISFAYPSYYALSEVTDARTDTFSATLISASATIPINSEGPPSISMEAFPNLAHVPLEQWLVAHAAQSNYLLPGVSSTSITVAGLPAISYIWSGLYNGRSVAFSSGDNIFIFTGTYDSPEDQIKKDFDVFLGTIKIK